MADHAASTSAASSPLSAAAAATSNRDMDSGGGEAAQVALTLQLHPPRWGLASACPRCLRAWAYLRLCVLPHHCLHCPALIASEDLPAIEDRDPDSPPLQPHSAASPSTSAFAGEQQGPATAASAATAAAGAVAEPRQTQPAVALASFVGGRGGMEGYLRVHRGVDLDAALTGGERIEVMGLTALVESCLDEALECELWVEPDNARVQEELYSSALPWPLWRVLLWQQRRARGSGGGKSRDTSGSGGGGGAGGGGRQQQGGSGGMWGALSGISIGGAAVGSEEAQAGAAAAALGREGVYLKARRAYAALAERLGHRHLFYNDRPTSLDAALYAHLAFVFRAPLRKSRLREDVEKHPNLVRFVERLEERMETLSSPSARLPFPPFTRIPLRPRPSTGAKSEHEAVEEQQKRSQQRRGWLFVAAQLGAVLAYVLFSVVSVEVAEDEDGEEEEEEGAAAAAVAARRRYQQQQQQQQQQERQHQQQQRRGPHDADYGDNEGGNNSHDVEDDDDDDDDDL